MSPVSTSTLKSFAPRLRRELQEAVERKLGYVLTGDSADLRANKDQVERLREQAESDRADLVERVAYTWFNRLAALRFLDARGWHPFQARVLTPATPGETQPELLKVVRTGTLPQELRPFTDPTRLQDLLDGRLPSSDPQGEVYRHLVLSTCRFYHDLMPFLFEALDDETELLLPDDLLSEHSVAQGFRTEISEEDCQDVEVLGWLYQFYISERKDEVMARKTAVPSRDIPAVTQLFTPHWIVRYLVENSLGRLWLRSRPRSNLKAHMPYYVEDPEGQPPDSLTVSRPEDIRLLDPACGSGHMLTYAFDLLTRIYEEEGYAPSEIPEKILTHNLYGLEICPRATQLAQFALVCKAREQSRSAFRSLIQPQVICLQDVVINPEEIGAYLRLPRARDLFDEDALRQVHQFRENTSTFGSLIQPILSEGEILALKKNLEALDPSGDLLLQETHRKIFLALDQAEMLTQRYHVVVTNPPYMGGKQMNGTVKTFAKDRYTNSKSDVFAMFIERGFSFAVAKGYVALVTMQSWMFLSSFERLREAIISTKSILCMAHLGAHAFDTIGGEVVQTTAFVTENGPNVGRTGVYARLNEGNDESAKISMYREAIADPNSPRLFRVIAAGFNKVSGSPIAYWATPLEMQAFERCNRLEESFDPRQGMATGDNDRFVRDWYEVSQCRCFFGCESKTSAFASGRKWFPYNKGGGFRRWYGNQEDLIAFDQESYSVLKDQGNHCPSEHLYFRECLGWSKVSSGIAAFRHYPKGFIFDVAGCSIFTRDQTDLGILAGFLNSNVAKRLLSFLSPTMNFEVGTIKLLPLCRQAAGLADETAEVCDQALSLARTDWDNSETSWDFEDLPLLRLGLKAVTLEASWQNWESHLRTNIARMQELETENNRLWIEAYGLEEELSPGVPEGEITLARPDRRKDVAAFLSYAVGCMMGRYSLDKPGLMLADAGDSVEEYLAKVGRSADELTYPPDEDGIVPVLDGEWFEDDIVARTRDFLRATFGAATLEENLHFIEESLGKDLRKYFLTDFYKDHLQTYKKRPIYWMFQSPKRGFQCLAYLHRYTKDTANRVLNRYLRDYLGKLEARLDYLNHLLASESTPAREKTKAQKETDALRKTLRECQEWERAVLLPLAQQRVEIDLDDGVRVNYLKLGPALAPIPGLAGKGE